MILEEYRVQLIERLRACCDPAAARILIAEAESVLANAGLTLLTQDRFWETLYEDLDAIGGETKSMSDREAAVKLVSVVVAAQARIARCRDKIAADGDG